MRALIRAGYCICGKHMLEDANEGTCLSCGHGDVHAVPELAYGRVMSATVTSLDQARAVVVERPRPRWTDDDCIQAAREWELMYGDLPSARDWMAAKQPGEDRPSFSTVMSIFGGWTGFKSAIADVPREELLAA